MGKKSKNKLCGQKEEEGKEGGKREGVYEKERRERGGKWEEGEDMITWGQIRLRNV